MHIHLLYIRHFTVLHVKMDMHIYIENKGLFMQSIINNTLQIHVVHEHVKDMNASM